MYGIRNYKTDEWVVASTDSVRLGDKSGALAWGSPEQAQRELNEMCRRFPAITGSVEVRDL